MRKFAVTSLLALTLVVSVGVPTDPAQMPWCKRWPEFCSMAVEA